MSISDPLIKEIKEWTLKLLDYYTNHVPIFDNNPNLESFCVCIEKILSKGLTPQHNSLGFVKTPNAWNWMSKVDCSNFKYSSSLDIVNDTKNIFTSVGCLRLLIRSCLVKKCLHIPIISLIQDPMLHSFYLTNGSIIGDEILVQIFLSVLMQCSKFKFILELDNSSFLDLSWMLPTVVEMEVVPCKTLGLSVKYSHNKAVIVDIQPNGVAAENGKIEVGDVLEELNGVHISKSTRGNLGNIMKKREGKPVSIKVIKAKITQSEIYFPIVPLLKQIKIDTQIFGQKKIEACDTQKCTSAGYKVTYLGNVSTGSSGEVKKIEFAVRCILTPYKIKDDKNVPKIEKNKKNVCFELGEIGIKCIDAESGEELFTHSYMEISSCGSVTGLDNYFAYIAGDDLCNLAKKFSCYIFHAKKEDVSTILNSIGQGFLRTHFAV